MAAYQVPSGPKIALTAKPCWASLVVVFFARLTHRLDVKVDIDDLRSNPVPALPRACAYFLLQVSPCHQSAPCWTETGERQRHLPENNSQEQACALSGEAVAT